jgi:hypothetical protein
MTSVQAQMNLGFASHRLRTPRTPHPVVIRDCHGPAAGAAAVTPGQRHWHSLTSASGTLVLLGERCQKTDMACEGTTCRDKWN